MPCATPWTHGRPRRSHETHRNYIWLENEIRDALSDAGLADDADFAVAVYGLDQGTNFVDSLAVGQRDDGVPIRTRAQIA